MTNDRPATLFAPPERVSRDLMARQAETLLAMKLLPKLFDSIEQMVAVLNSQRQIVLANRALRERFAVESAPCLVGLRPGEAVGCIHANRAEAGCGTAEACSQCGAVDAILASRSGRTETRECRISRLAGAEPLDLLVRAAPLQLEDATYTIFSMRDISSQKRLEALERIFFHDVLNTAGAVKGLAEILSMVGEEEREGLRRQLVVASSRLLAEIASHRFLSQAERGELVCSVCTVDSLRLVDELAWSYGAHEVASERRIGVDEHAEAVQLELDAGLLSRVLGNMLKNALEACPEGGCVTIGCRRDGGGVRFHVHGPTPMPRDVQLQVFQRSFSTKGAGRGLGTYSMKLLTEKYL